MGFILKLLHIQRVKVKIHIQPLNKDCTAYPVQLRSRIAPHIYDDGFEQMADARPSKSALKVGEESGLKFK